MEKSQKYQCPHDKKELNRANQINKINNNNNIRNVSAIYNRSPIRYRKPSNCLKDRLCRIINSMDNQRLDQK